MLPGGANGAVQLAGYWGINLQTASGQLVMLNNGYVGIGTTTPDQKLTVKGTMHAEEVLVDLSVPGPDYVFKPSYKLITLGEIKAYVDKHQHLPEIPSAAQMEKDGINLSEMNMKLLKKVEELTLYLIEKDNQVKDQENRLKKIEAQFDALTPKR